MKLWVMKEILNNIDWDEDQVFIRDDNDVLHDIVLIRHDDADHNDRSVVLLLSAPLKELLDNSGESYKRADRECKEFLDLKGRFDQEMSQIEKIKDHE